MYGLPRKRPLSVDNETQPSCGTDLAHGRAPEDIARVGAFEFHDRWLPLPCGYVTEGLPGSRHDRVTS